MRKTVALVAVPAALYSAIGALVFAGVQQLVKSGPAKLTAYQVAVRWADALNQKNLGTACLLWNHREASCPGNLESYDAFAGIPTIHVLSNKPTVVNGELAYPATFVAGGVPAASTVAGKVLVHRVDVGSKGRPNFEYRVDKIA